MFSSQHEPPRAPIALMILALAIEGMTAAGLILCAILNLPLIALVTFLAAANDLSSRLIHADRREALDIAFGWWGPSFRWTV